MKKLLICLSLLVFGLLAQEEETDAVWEEDEILPEIELEVELKSVQQKPAQIEEKDSPIVLKPLERRSVEWYKSFKYYKNDKILQALVALYYTYKETPVWLWELLDWQISMYGNTKYGQDDRIKEAKARIPAHKLACLERVFGTQKYVDNIVEPVQGIMTKVHNPRINGLLVVLMDEPAKFGYFVPYCLAND
ncbi:MAG: hypothetical protein LBH98_03310 [Chitinispirillales bacterium]|jgi:hypothetical protein|nr:hypothetical protein [Chitinispirillales bacterium]